MLYMECRAMWNEVWNVHLCPQVSSHSQTVLRHRSHLLASPGTRHTHVQAAEKERVPHVMYFNILRIKIKT